MISPYLIESFQRLGESVSSATLRVVKNTHEVLTIRNDIPVPPTFAEAQGYMITVWDGGGVGYGSSSDFSPEGIASAFHAAKTWANFGQRHFVYDFSKIDYAHERAHFQGGLSNQDSWFDKSWTQKIELLHPLCSEMKISDRIVMREVGVHAHRMHSMLISTQGAQIFQEIDRITPSLLVSAGNGKGDFETRSFGKGNLCWQGGIEALVRQGYFAAASHLAHEAEALLAAPSCPVGTFDLLLAPDQMVLQIHESIGHPLELDRILGDERNYAGTSFVTLDMFGKYQYGSDLLNITFDPTVPGEIASYSHDDEGTPAEKTYLIENGLLKRALGGLSSQARAKGIEGVACARSCNWNRPAIDRMANLNLEPGNSSQEDLIGRIEKGVWMQTNSSWSIDDSRNKFQFGCEMAYWVENGKVKHLLRKPNYRGISRDFWRNLIGVGNEQTSKVMGSPYCGKGEPNQSIYVGHRSPTCLFRAIEVFGGGQ
jgi:predicted Zn-dependent protease